MTSYGAKPDRILRWPEVKEQTGLSRTTAWREVRAGRFPAPIKLTDHAIGWRQSDLDDWLASRQKSA
jgi:prophage regulatory protein